MTENSKPWNGITTGDAGPYSDADWQELYRYIIGWGGGRGNNGVFLSSGTQPDDGLRVLAQNPATADIDVHPGSALVQGIAYINDDIESLTVAPNASGNPRIDTVILRADYALQTVRLVLKQGTAAASPVRPTLTQTASVMWEIPIADIAVANGFSSISQSNITPRQEWVNAPPAVYLDNVLNNSGGELITGDVVIVDTSADRAATTTTVRGHYDVMGVWVGTTAAAGYGRVLTNGIGYVNASAAVTRGNHLLTHTVAKQAAATSGQLFFATALETTSGAGLVLCYVSPNQCEDYIQISDEKAQNTAGGTFTSGSFQTRVLTTELFDTGAYASLNVGNNRITLLPGTYRFYITCPAFRVDAHLARLQNITDATTVKNGSSEVSGSAINAPPSRSIIAGELTITASKDFEVQHRCTTTRATDGLGIASNFAAETYTIVEFWRKRGQ